MRNGLVISLDGMGGDRAPQIVVEGAHLAREKYPQAKFIIYGDAAQLKPLIARYPGLSEVMELRHTPDRVAAGDKPAAALRQGRNSSMRLAIDAVSKGEADCVVSAGNTGALMALAKFSLKVMPGIHRPAIGTFMPSKVAGHGTIFLDLGANAECSTQNLLEFAVLGGVFSRELFRIPEPRIALLNIGSEAMKGDELVQAASDVFANAKLPGKYVGFAEGDEVMTGDYDVIVTDGFTGNVALKTMEGTARHIKFLMKEALNSSLWVKLGALLSLPGLLICYGALKNFSKRIDPRYYNGASLLGLRGLCIKSHGGVDGIGFCNAIGVAAGLALGRFTEKVEAELKRLDMGQSPDGAPPAPEGAA